RTPYRDADRDGERALYGGEPAGDGKRGPVRGDEEDETRGKRQRAGELEQPADEAAKLGRIGTGTREREHRVDRSRREPVMRGERIELGPIHTCGQRRCEGRLQPFARKNNRRKAFRSIVIAFAAPPAAVRALHTIREHRPRTPYGSVAKMSPACNDANRGQTRFSAHSRVEIGVRPGKYV